MANMNTNSAMVTLTPDQIASLPANEQQAYLQRMTPAQQSLVAQAGQQQIVQANRHFMRKSVERTAMCPVTGGSGQTATYAAGQTLYFDFPTVPGFAKGILIRYNITVNPATGSGAAYALNQAAPFNIFSEVDVLYNGFQVRSHPYFACKIMDQLEGRATLPRNGVLTGANNDNTINTNLVGGTPILVATNNVWQGVMYLRLNALGEDTVPGVLPLSGVGNKPQIKLTCVPNFLGVDPLINPIASSGGTGNAITISAATVSCDMVYVDGVTMENTLPLSLQWQNEPTLQYYWDTALTPFSGGATVQRQTISTKLEHWYVCSIIIDGQQSNQFATLGNMTGFEFGPDQVGSQTWYNYNIANNISIYDFMHRFQRQPHKQDLDDGVLMWVDAPARGVINANNRIGNQFLNMYPGGYPAATHSYQVAAAGGVSGITPRVETFLVSINRAGLKVQ